LADDTIEYGYDELGRATTRQIGSAANTQTQAFDAQGRLTTLTNPLGSFSYTYEGTTGRPASLTYPNGQQTAWAYYDNLNDRRLREIHNKRPGGATLSRFEYTYDKAGNILTWLQQADSDPAKIYQLGYDNADQLTAAILTSTDPSPAILKRYYYTYDSAGNRTAEQIDDAVTSASYNNMNQLVSQQAGGALVFKGTVSEPANVTVGGRPATVTADNRFEGQAVAPGGTGNVTVTATDPSGNVRTSTYEINQGATSKSFTYDLNGNTTSDGTRSYEWDADNRLVAVKEGGNTVASYAYRHDGIRASKTAGGVTTNYVLEDDSVVEERLASGRTTKHFPGVGIDNVLAMDNGTAQARFLTRDHLGSVREHVSNDGTVLLRRAYDPWGAPTAAVQVEGWAFTGREYEPDAQAYYYRARYYIAWAGRFLSVDPSGFEGGPNAYSYASGNPLVRTDPTGLTDLNLFDPQQKLKNNQGQVVWPHLAASLYTNKERFVVAGHGSGSPATAILDDRLGVSNRKPLNAQQLMVEMQAKGWKKGMKVELLACEAGAPNALASALATVLQTRVEGPTNVIGWNEMWYPGKTWRHENGGTMAGYE
jgi:RHS repeat-associated protein